ncbi:hypothetical protein [Polaromonas sp. YR568]|uniref:hypothetical protein n=1 Tax=Polaromonas sp. YR568 TaxID=1855301 RepID=UPI003137920B
MSFTDYFRNVAFQPKAHDLVLVILLSVAALFVGWVGFNKQHQSVQFQNIEYRGNSSADANGKSRPTTTPLQLAVLPKGAELQSLDISLNFEVADDGLSYGNLFQTGDSDKAIRMEFQPPNNLVLILGDGKILPVSDSIQAGRQYFLRLQYAASKLFLVNLNGLEVLSAPNMKSYAEKLDISHIVVGTGLAAKRTLAGSIKNFNLDAAYKTEAPLGILLLLGVLMLALLCLVGRNAITQVRGAGEYFRGSLQLPALVTICVVTLQLSLVLLFPAYRIIVITYLFLFAIGIGINPVISSKVREKERFIFLLLAPLSGLLLVVVVGGFFIGLSLDIRYLVAALICLSMLGLLVNFYGNRANLSQLLSEMWVDLPRALVIVTVILTPLILLLIYPVLTSGYLTSPIRVAPDMAFYAYAEQFFLDGATWMDANKRVKEFEGMSAVEFNQYGDSTLSWALFYFFRWGTTAYHTLVTIVTFSKQAYETIFLSMVIPHLLQCGLIFFWLKKQKHVGTGAALIGFFAFALNANVLNFWYEGFYANALGLCFFTLLMMGYEALRVSNQDSQKETVRQVLLLALVFVAGFFCLIDGAVFILLPFFMFAFLVDLLINRSIKWRPYIILVIGWGLAMLVLPSGHVVDWARYAWAQLMQAGGNGYMQPHWALPHEILGFVNIYELTLQSPGTLLSRSTLNIIFGCVLSYAILHALILNFKITKPDVNVLQIASIVFVVIWGVLIFWKKPDNNYLYMKIYIFFAAILFMAFWSAIGAIFDKYSSSLVAKNIVFLLMGLPIIASGSNYIIQYKNEATLIEEFKISLHEDVKGVNFQNVIMYPYRLQSNRVMYPAILSTPWIVPGDWVADRWKDKPYFRSYLNHKVYLFVEKDMNKKYELQAGTIIFENACCLIVDSGKLLKDGVKTDQTIDFQLFTKALEKPSQNK